MQNNITVDFHILNSNLEDDYLYVARLTEKAYTKNCHIFIYTSSEAQSAQIDCILWTYRNNSFLPHHIIEPGAGAAPILISHTELPPRKDVLINLTKAVPPFCSDFSRVIELVSSPETSKIIGREKYKHYQILGCLPRIFQIPR